jgi:hypothetical protein
MRKINIINEKFITDKLSGMIQSEITTLINWKIYWKKIGNFCLASSKFFMGVSLISNFISGFYNIKTFNFAAGCANTIAVVSLSYSSYSFNESTKRNNDLYDLLVRLNIKINGFLEKDVMYVKEYNENKDEENKYEENKDEENKDEENKDEEQELQLYKLPYISKYNKDDNKPILLTS